jgi:hypothetical protein
VQVRDLDGWCGNIMRRNGIESAWAGIGRVVRYCSKEERE